ncbi:MAG: hypothetical protein OEY64_05740 [Nitrospinota bacterium]|nr:hypothetical protein [Nitrospinota bacterium]
MRKVTASVLALALVVVLGAGASQAIELRGKNILVGQDAFSWMIYNTSTNLWDKY